jgi:aspartyl-tRNA(Asn)/glutamyl-tRNA(Gln) amidotransferase subunit A
MTAPAISPDLIELGVVETAQAIREGTVSPVDLLEALLDQIDALEPSVKAWTYLDRDALRTQAQRLAEEAAAGTFRGAMHGVPVALKDVFHVEGMPTRADSEATSDEPATRDCTPAARMRAAGAIIMGKLHTAEFAASLLQPHTRNPWNTEHNAGGSSSGSGAAVGGRMTMATIGTQTGGSNLRPAAYCGVSGFMATYGRVSRAGLLANSWSLDHPGILARSVEDLALVFSVIGGPDPRDDTTLSEPAPSSYLEMAGYRPPRIGVFRGFFEDRAEPEMVATIDARANDLREAGATVTEVAVPENFGVIAAAAPLITQAEKSTVHAARMGSRAHQYGAHLRASNEAGMLIPAPYYLQAQRIRRWLTAEMRSLFADVDVLLLPTAPGPAPHGDYTGDPVFLSPWTFLGYPATTIPGGLSSDGLPLGLQFVGPPMEDYELLRASNWAQGIIGKLPAPPRP